MSYGYPSSSPEGKIIKTVKGREYTVLFPRKGTINHTITIPVSGGKKSFLLLKIHLENMQKVNQCIFFLLHDFKKQIECRKLDVYKGKLKRGLMHTKIAD